MLNTAAAAFRWVYVIFWFVKIVFFSCPIAVAGWNKDYKAGPIPQTDAEREAAAKKYHLLPEEYKPYADNGMGYGDYPELKGGLGVEARDAFYPYDYPELKRNYQETVSLPLYFRQKYNFIFSI